MLTYPEFQALPVGIKKMLLASETHFFAEAGKGGQPQGRQPARVPGWEWVLQPSTAARGRDDSNFANGGRGFVVRHLRPA